MNETETQLPDKPSELLRVAINDLKETLKDENVEFHPFHWMYKRPDGKCMVCLAGAVMLNSLNFKFIPSNTNIAFACNHSQFSIHIAT